MTVYELASKIPNDDPNKEFLIMAQVMLEAQELRAEIERLAEKASQE